MKLFLPILLMLLLHAFPPQKRTMNYLALGDSYTIGEGVPVYENFPYQVVQMLRKKNILVNAPEIVAKTGWTTDELLAGIEQTQLLPSYDFVTLLIGVNNQYRNRELANYEKEFTQLLNIAIEKAGGNKKRVIVLSIPDWSVTPFAAGKDGYQIARQIDAFNEACGRISNQLGIDFISITQSMRRSKGDPTLIADDGLHPSGKEYRIWAELIVDHWQKVLK